MFNVIKVVLMIVYVFTFLLLNHALRVCALYACLAELKKRREFLWYAQIISYSRQINWQLFMCECMITAGKNEHKKSPPKRALRCCAVRDRRFSPANRSRWYTKAGHRGCRKWTAGGRRRWPRSDRSQQRGRVPLQRRRTGIEGCPHLNFPARCGGYRRQS